MSASKQRPLERKTKKHTTKLTLCLSEPGLQGQLCLPLLLGLAVSLGDGLVEELVDAVDDVGTDEGEPAEATTVHHTDRQRRTVDLLLFFSRAE